MPIDTPARTEVLRRIRTALGDETAPASATLSADWHAIPRTYQRAATLGRRAILELLDDRLRDYDANVVHVSAADLASTIAALLAARGNPRMVAPCGFAEGLAADFQQTLPEGLDVTLDDNLSYDQLNAIEGVLTTAQIAIATTGTLVLQNVPGQGRRAATLIPDYHLCIVREQDVVETVPEAFARLVETAALATTFISGPSATADIEMTRIKGVHGPRFLDVILVR
ncbi:MAG: LUD domain-containing protein [Acidobacteriota bacterium]|nr:LUD domain-containing protein [Acidobacteriota bacterium]